MEPTDPNKQQEARQEADVVVKTETPLARLLEKVNLEAPEETIDAERYAERATLAEAKPEQNISAALAVVIRLLTERGEAVEQINKADVSRLIDHVDTKISDQLDEILHHEEFQEIESAWRGLHRLVSNTQFHNNILLELLNVSKEELAESFNDVEDTTQAPLYLRVYTDAYDQPGAHPYGVMISNYEFNSTGEDIKLLRNISKVAAAAHAPFIGSVGGKFFQVDSFEEWKKTIAAQNPAGALNESAAFIKWNGFRETEDARYVGLVMPRFLLREPYGPDGVPVKGFTYTETVVDPEEGPDHDKYLWGNATYAFGSNLTEAFARDGWTVQIRGPKSGGKVDNLPVPLYDMGKGLEKKIPTEVKISETEEFNFAELGFIPLTVWENSDYAVFLSANSAQRPVKSSDPRTMASRRINARLPYIFLASRLAHYLKVFQREQIGQTASRESLEEELNTWLKTHITEMPNPGPELIAERPLRSGHITVEEIEDNPGFFRVQMTIQPHFQIEGMDIDITMVGKMPGKTD